MAVGVPENEVFAAADALLARGERPTVERVRLELGRGSPARVGGLLDQWWARLAERLNGATRLPTLPGEVSQAFVAVWQQAIQVAQGVVDLGLCEQRQVLNYERERMATEEDQAFLNMAKARLQVAEAIAGRQSAELRLADLELLLSQRQTQIDDLNQQRISLAHERHEAQQHNQELQQELQALRLKADQECVAQENYVRGVEDRARREIDRAREERKAVANQLKTASRKSDDLQRKLELSQGELSQALQRATAQLVQIRQLPEIKRKPRARKSSTPVNPEA
ncbi:DNA-binding protein [Pseudomonas fluorescens]|uniref:KfrA N-terminal DNA-binding domain-containing protein n=1 Tax=Pseudomonas fluorescens TaxID=294 RepID=A0A109KX77_PSEFL|nr:DNA-binding protein [Pseudomonas fluorescens]KWV77044.1 hypothetical protein PFL603g_02426 [Pseudomonas fluorescens]